MKILFIGDVHAKFKELDYLLQNHTDRDFVVQVGDLGIGFHGISYPESVSPDFNFIRGNHDNPDVCRRHREHLGDFGFMSDISLFYLAGAYSIDKAIRTEGSDWWRDEELNMEQLQEAIDLYEKEKPRIMVTHDCPNSITRLLHGENRFSNNTGQALEICFKIHKPQIWIHGHHHISHKTNIDGTLFIGLSELEPYLLEI